MSEAVPSETPSAVDQAAEVSTIPQGEGEPRSAAHSLSNGDQTATSPAATEVAAAGTTTTVAVDGLAADDTAETHDEHGSVEGEEATAASPEENAVEINGVLPNDVKNIILQVLSPYFDDEGGEDDAQRYDHIKAQGWIQLICDGIMEKLLSMRRPYKFVTHCMIMRKCGAGIHVCSSCYYSQADGWVNHAHDLSAHIYAVVSVYWSVI
ncbi:putative dynein light chain [Trypanosoma grayi]|uniref:putative dynein light chain n=1 Tax=Trypanosoma grayi TaxID=71804 RepID=UPI0004F43C3C|nr:putative dynein light chain [Trypanosoma grayi]KEG09214.1 putative dynein light chain [Trypanosoma grayi]